jgi:hypothetical protein
LPTISIPSPLSAASDAVGAFGAERDKQQTRKDALEQKAYDRGRDTKSDTLNEQRQTLEQAKFDETQKTDEANRQSQAMTDAITKENNTYTISQRPLAEAATAATLKYNQGLITAQQLAATQAIIKQKADKAEADYYQRVYHMTKDEVITKNALASSNATIAESVQRTAQGWAHVGIAQGQLKLAQGKENFDESQPQNAFGGGATGQKMGAMDARAELPPDLQAFSVRSNPGRRTSSLWSLC